MKMVRTIFQIMAVGLARIGGLVFCAHAGFSCGGLNIAEHQIDALYAGAGELVTDAQDDTAIRHANALAPIANFPSVIMISLSTKICYDAF